MSPQISRHFLLLFWKILKTLLLCNCKLIIQLNAGENAFKRTSCQKNDRGFKAKQEKSSLSGFADSYIEIALFLVNTHKYFKKSSFFEKKCALIIESNPGNHRFRAPKKSRLLCYKFTQRTLRTQKKLPKELQIEKSEKLKFCASRRYSTKI